MSVTSLLQDPRVRDRLDSLLPPRLSRIDAAIRVPPRSFQPGLIGTAFDYALRFDLQRRHPVSKSDGWVAENAIRAIHNVTDDEDAHLAVANSLSTAQRQVDAYLSSDGADDTLRPMIKASIRLAKLDAIFRAGVLDSNLEDTPATEVEEVHSLLRAFPHEQFPSPRRIDLNPTFGRFSAMVGGADADLIIDGTLIDLKVTRNDKIERDYFRQLVSYAILARAARDDGEDTPGLHTMGVYFARHAHFHSLPLGAIYGHPEYQQIASWYLDHAAEKYASPAPSRKVRRAPHASPPPLKKQERDSRPERRLPKSPPTARTGPPGTTTPYHAKYYAHELTRLAPGGDLSRISQSLFDACVDLNPHQIEAGLFALRSPLSRGVILADEVGLGKTIEAGLVMCQYWAERRRRILVIAPASIRKQWQLELSQKFNLPSTVLDSKGYKELQKKGHTKPFEQDHVVIVSYPYASRMRAEIEKVPWDLVILDEAHRLRNPNGKASQNLREALRNAGKKLLLTATPLQNNLAELHTLTTFIDEHTFGDRAVFQARYTFAAATDDNENLHDLRQRLEPFVKRTLRKDVLEYINYTQRQPITVTFDPTAPENQLYERVSEFLQRPETYAIPHRQRHLITLILRKILASSTTALATTLTRMRDRLQALAGGAAKPADDLEALIEDEAVDEEEIEDEADEDTNEPAVVISDVSKLHAEIAELNEFIALASTIKVDSKSQALLEGLDQGFAKMDELGAARKALIFTESRRTQQYLKHYLEANGYAGGVTIFNGTNTEPECRAIYDAWLAKNAPLGRTSGNRNIDMRTALIEHFRDQGTILLATEAAGEGVNLQFCSLVVNYDLPWNPQRIEQRIGRCHRYGQKHDVVVVNFLNPKNHADARVLELLTEKFRLFQGVFGSSDEVLGSLESGVDFEKKIHQIYQTCRKPEEIQAAFNKLQQEMEAEIKSRTERMRQMLLEHFDEEVHTRFRNFLSDTQAQLNRVEAMLWKTTQHVLDGHATFPSTASTFHLRASPIPAARPGEYHLNVRSPTGRQESEPNEFLYRLSHPLGEHVLDTAKRIQLAPAEVEFPISAHPTRISVVEALRGQHGWLRVTKLRVESYGAEEHLLFTAFTSDGKPLDPEVAEKLFECGGHAGPVIELPPEAAKRLDEDTHQHVQACLARVMESNEVYFLEEQDRLERWAEDLKESAKTRVEESEARIRELSKLARQATSLQERLDIQERKRQEEARQKKDQQAVFDAYSDIQLMRDNYIDQLQKQLEQRTSTEQLFTIKWKVT